MEINTLNLVKKYKGIPAVNGISLNVRQGEVVGLLGPNGAGKTTTFYMIVGLTRPSSGRVMFDDEDVTRRPMYRRSRAGISYLPQENSVFRNLTVEENVQLVLQMLPLSSAQRRERTDHLLEDLHIAHLRHRQGRLLSGGERRRVEIARALASNPKFILLDEPFTGVDPKAIEDIEEIIKRLSKSEAKIGILITDHNVEAMVRITERVYIIAGGQKRFEGPSKDMENNPEARKHYLGENYGRGRDFAREAAEEELRRMSGEDEEYAGLMGLNGKEPRENGSVEKEAGAAEQKIGDAVCPECGGANTPDSRFCRHCGRRLAGEPDAARR